MRCCFTICQDSNFANVGYCNKFTLEIQNHGKVPVVLIVGQQIAQILFYQTGDVINSYSKNGTYNIGDLQDVKDNWSPLCMIPGIAVNSLIGENYNTWIKKRKLKKVKENKKVKNKKVKYNS
jgi:hypothetical protein